MTYVAVDFDGTICREGAALPAIGAPVPGAIDALLWLQSLGVGVFLWTGRERLSLRAAVDCLAQQGITVRETAVNPETKAACAAFIDDKAIGCPLIQCDDGTAYVDWASVRTELQQLLAVRGIQC